MFSPQKTGLHCSTWVIVIKRKKERPLLLLLGKLLLPPWALSAFLDLEVSFSPKRSSSSCPFGNVVDTATDDDITGIDFVACTD